MSNSQSNPTDPTSAGTSVVDRSPSDAAIRADVIVTVKGGKFPPTTDVSKQKKSRVQWDNQDDVGYSLDFDKEGWPFVDPPHVILIPARGVSEVVTVWQGTDKGGYHFTVRKPGFKPKTPGGPPDPPQVNVGD